MLRQSKTNPLQPDIDIVYTRWRLDHKRPGCGRYVVMSFLTSLLCRPIQNLVFACRAIPVCLFTVVLATAISFLYACLCFASLCILKILRFMYFVFYTTPSIFFDSCSFGKGGCARFSALGRFFSFRGNELGLGWLLFFGFLYHLGIGGMWDIRDTNTDWKFVHRRFFAGMGKSVGVVL